MSISDTARVPRAIEARVTLRVVALYEAAKAVLALTLGALTLGVMRGDFDSAIVALVQRLGLSPDGAVAALLMHSMQRAESIGRHTVIVLVLAYATIRLMVACGLWLERVWGEWLGAVSGSIYLPFEAEAMFRHPGWLPTLVLAGNLAIVLYLCARLWYRRSRAKAALARRP